MPHEWPSSGRLPASPRACATTESQALDQVTGAFVDGAPVDWPALLRRVTGAHERSFIENIRLLDRIRGAHPPFAWTADARPALAVRAIVWVAAAQALSGLAVVGFAVVDGAFDAARGPQLALALAFSAAGVVLGATVSRDARRLFLLAMFACASSAFTRGALTGAPPALARIVDPLFRGLCLEALMPACLWQFALGFPRVHRFTAFDVLARRFTATAWTLGVIALLANTAVAYGLADAHTFAILIPRRGNTLFWSAFTLTVLPAVGAIVIRSRHAPAAEKRRVARFAEALAAGSAPFLTVGVTRTLVPSIRTWLASASPVERLWLDIAVIAGLVAMPMLATLAIVVDRPFELQARFWPVSRLNIARRIASLSAVAALGMAAIAAYAWRDVPLHLLATSSRGSLIVMLTGSAVLLTMVRLTVLSAHDAVGRGSLVDRDRALRRAVGRLQLARGNREIVHILRDELASSASTGRVEVLTFAAGDADQSTPLPPSDGVLVTIVAEASEAVDISMHAPLLRLLPPGDRQWATDHSFELAAPVRRRDGELAAIVLVGARHDRLPHGQHGRVLVATLTSAAAALWESTIAATNDSPEPALECARCGIVVDGPLLPCDCGTVATLAAAPHVLVAKFQLERRLGAGGMGVVYLAHDASIGRNVALKTIPRLGAERLQRLRDEARTMGSFNHEALATIYGLELWRDEPILVVEYFARGTLASQLSSGPLAAGATMTMGRDLAAGLAYMHARGVLHRDVKPSNIARTESGRVKLLDFGLSTLMDADAAELWKGDAAIAGTVPYLSPEVCGGTPADPAADLWALAVVMLEALTGANPFVARSREETIERIQELDLASALADSARRDSSLAAFLERALSRRPGERFQSATEFGAALERLSRR